MSETKMSTASTESTGVQTNGVYQKMHAENLSIYYGKFRAVAEVTVPVREKMITAIIGPSGCGKSTLLRSFNRMNDLVAVARVSGKIMLDGLDIYGTDVDLSLIHI